MKVKGPLFYSKILLFGEYGIIKNSKGLSIPYNFYNGALKSSEQLNEEQQASNHSLLKLATYLKENQKTDLVAFELERLFKDIQAGLYFDSSIPMGYGVGSSGALVCLLYTSPSPRDS